MKNKMNFKFYKMLVNKLNQLESIKKIFFMDGRFLDYL